MKFTNVIVGAIVAAIGAGIGYVDYYIVSLFYEISLWISGLLNAPEAFATVLTILMTLIVGGLILTIALIAVILFIAGILVMTGREKSYHY